MSKSKMSFAEILKRDRVGLGMTQAEFATKVGLKLCNINAYEQGRSRPKMESLQRIAKYLKRDITELI